VTEITKLDIAMFGFWGGRFENVFIVITQAPNGIRDASLKPHMYRKHETVKKRHYEANQSQRH
jgi:hypothetical protein